MAPFEHGNDIATMYLTDCDVRDVPDWDEVDCVDVGEDLGRDLLDGSIHLLSEQILNALRALDPHHLACSTVQTHWWSCMTGHA